MKPKDILLSGVLLWILSQTVSAADNLSLTFNAGDNIRDLAALHLRNPDLWLDILHANRLKAIHELKPGMKLKIPVRLILEVEEAFQQVQDKISLAARQGAQALASKILSRAIRQRDQAVDKRQAGQWKEALLLLKAALRDARSALQETQKKRNEPIQAVLEQARGKVQRRKTADFYWHSASGGNLLEEREKVRTLARAHALIRFHDDSKLELAADTQIVIRKMRQDRLNKQGSTGVVLFKGDLHALLGGGSRRAEQFDVAVKGVKTKIKSRKFWMDKQGDKALFANYEGEMEVSSGGGTVVLKANQGTVVKANQKPAAAKNLLPMPKPLKPQNYATIYGDGVNFSWKPQPGAHAYRLEAAHDQAFNQRVSSLPSMVMQTQFYLPLPDSGLYYWRLAGVDADGLPGVQSKTRFFKIQKDTLPPYLLIAEPRENSIVRQSPVTVRGTTEQDARLSFNGQVIELSKDGAFQFNHPLQTGVNVISLTARDPAGNQAKLSRTLEYMPDEAVDIHYDAKLIRKAEKHFVTRQSALTLRGQTKPDNHIEVKAADGRQFFKTLADKQGRFQLNLPLREKVQRFALESVSPSGFRSTDSFLVEWDKTPPLIHLSSRIPARTATADLLIAGTLEGTARLNGQALILDAQGGFSRLLNLQPGENKIQLQAQDMAGNVSRRQKSVILDQAPPRLLKHTISPKRVKGGETLRITVYAKDESGMKAGAAYRLKIAQTVLAGYLRLCPDRQCYQGRIQAPLNAKGHVTLESLRLEDYLGNQKTYILD